MEEDRARRLAAKRHNERMKLVAGFFNALGIAVAGAAVILPAIQEPSFLRTTKPWILLFVALALHSVAHASVGLMRSGD